MAENTPGPHQLDPDNGRANFAGNFSRFGKGMPLGGSQPGEGTHDLPDGTSVGMSSAGGTKPPGRLADAEVAGERPSNPLSHY